MSEIQSKLRQFNLLFLHEKQEYILDYCYQKCTVKSKPGSSFSGRQLTCVQNCKIKLLNGYAFLFNIAKQKGINRADQSQLKKMVI